MLRDQLNDDNSRVYRSRLAGVDCIKDNLLKCMDNLYEADQQRSVTLHLSLKQRGHLILHKFKSQKE